MKILQILLKKFVIVSQKNSDPQSEKKCRPLPKNAGQTYKLIVLMFVGCNIIFAASYINHEATASITIHLGC